MISAIPYSAGLLILAVIFLLPMTLLAGIARVCIFHRMSRHRDMRMEPSTVIGLYKQQMDTLLFCIGYVLLLGVYSLLFFHFV
jgi:hypothetical protein